MSWARIGRRTTLKLAVACAALAALSGAAWAADKDTVTIAWPADVPGWDPNQRFVPDAQVIYKAVFDQPLDQNPDITFKPHLIKSYKLAPDGLSMEFEVRDDVLFHDGSKMTAADIRYTFFERIQKQHKVDTIRSWGEVTDIEVLSPTKGVFKFKQPKVTAPQWLGFLGSFVVPRDYMEKVGPDAFREKPIGTGPYKLVEYQLNSRIVLERNDQYWGPKPKIKRVIYDIVKDPAARVAAVQSGQADLAVAVPVREASRLNKIAGLAGEMTPITRLILVHLRNDMAFTDMNVRLAVHHAVDKAAISKAFYEGAAVPLSTLSTPGTPAFDANYKFAYDPKKAAELLAKSGFGPKNPVKLKLATTNGHFPSDYEIARAMVAMWKKVGIEVEIEVIEYAKYFELNRGGKLPELTLYSWDNATGDPEITAGYLLHPKKPFGPWKGPEVGEKVVALETVVDYQKRVAGYRELERFALETGATMPLLQSVMTVVKKKNLAYTKYGNGWILPQTMSWQ